MSGGHRTAKVATHQCCYGNTWYVMLEDEEMEKSLSEYTLSKVVSNVIMMYSNLKN